MDEGALVEDRDPVDSSSVPIIPHQEVLKQDTPVIQWQ